MVLCSLLFLGFFESASADTAQDQSPIVIKYTLPSSSPDIQPWSQIDVQVHNQGNLDVQGSFRLQWNNRNTIFKQDMTLEAGERRTIAIPLVSQYASQLNLQFVQGQQIVNNVDVMTPAQEGGIPASVITVDEESLHVLNNWSALHQKRTDLPQDIPEHSWLISSGIIAIHEVNPSVFNADQLHALQDWVKTGGGIIY